MALMRTRKRGFRAAVCGFLTLCASFAGFSGAAAGADVRVVVDGLRNDRGNLLVAVCTEEVFLSAGCRYVAGAPAGEGTATVRGVPPGSYAVQAFHDENGNGTIDHTLRFFPLEGMGFSRDARMRRGPPRFADAAFELGDRDATLKLTMRYFQ